MNTGLAEAEEDRVSVASILWRLWQKRYLILGSMAFFLAVGLGYALLLPDRYTVSMTLGHVTSFETPGTSSTGSLASSLLGSKQDDPKFAMFQTVIKTEDFARALDAKYGYVKQMRAEFDVESVPQFAEFLKEKLVVMPGADEETIVISVDASDPEFAKVLLRRIFQEGNERVRNFDTQRAEKFAAYVQARFTAQPIKSLQDSMLGLLLTQERFLMTTRVDLPYAANLIDGPNSSEEPTSPKLLLMAIVGALVGMILAIAALFVWDSVQAERLRRGLPLMGQGRRIA